MFFDGLSSGCRFSGGDFCEIDEKAVDRAKTGR
jgi:hypothetical protein